MDGGHDDAEFDRAWDDREMSDLSRELGPIFRRHGVGAVDRSVARAEQQRVAIILGNDRAYRAREILRSDALQQVESGEYANIRDSVSAPTPEQVAQAERAGGGFHEFTPRGEDGTVRTVTAYRRKDLPQVAKLVLNGTIDAGAFRDCKWYRNLYELTGLSGSIGSVDYGREVFSAPHNRAMFADHQVEAQDSFRFIRSLIPTPELALLDQVVLHDIPIWRAARSSGAGWRNARSIMASAVDELARARAALNPES